MINAISIIVDQHSLLATVRFEQIDELARVEIILVLKTRGNTVEETEDTIRLPWNQLKRVLTEVFSSCREHSVSVNIEGFATKLVDQLSEDYRFFKNQDQPFIDLDETEIQPALSSLGFVRHLTPFQVRDVRELLRMRHGANFSVPGAGKTTSLLAVHTLLKAQGLVDRLVVVSPINAFVSWEEEIAAIYDANTPSVSRITASDLSDLQQLKSVESEVLLVNYEKLRRDTRTLLSLLRDNRFHLVLDEAHRIKGGQKNQSYLEIIRLADVVQRRDILTGTPMPQSCFDLNPEFDFLWGRKLIPEPFRGPSEDLVAFANAQVANRFTRTTKSELNLDPPEVTIHEIEMGPVQTELYNLIRSETVRILQNLDFETKEILRGLRRSVVRLMQAATNPMLLGAADYYNSEIAVIPEAARITEILAEFAKFEKPAKIEFLRDRVQTLLSANPDSKVVIWSYFVRNIWLVTNVLRQFKPLAIYGAIPSGSEDDETKREGILRKFKNEPDSRVLIANPQACGEGISLHRVCHNAIYLDRNFNAAHYLQSVDRVHRIGLPPGTVTNVEILSSVDTIDDVIGVRLQQKAAAMGAVLNDRALAQLAYDPADIDDADESGLDAGDVAALSAHLPK